MLERGCVIHFNRVGNRRTHKKTLHEVMDMLSLLYRTGSFPHDYDNFGRISVYIELHRDMPAPYHFQIWPTGKTGKNQFWFYFPSDWGNKGGALSYLDAAVAIDRVVIKRQTKQKTPTGLPIPAVPTADEATKLKDLQSKISLIYDSKLEDISNATWAFPNALYPLLNFHSLLWSAEQVVPQREGLDKYLHFMNDWDARDQTKTPDKDEWEKRLIAAVEGQTGRAPLIGKYAQDHETAYFTSPPPGESQYWTGLVKNMGKNFDFIFVILGGTKRQRISMLNQYVNKLFSDTELENIAAQVSPDPVPKRIEPKVHQDLAYCTKSQTYVSGGYVLRRSVRTGRVIGMTS